MCAGFVHLQFGYWYLQRGTRANTWIMNELSLPSAAGLEIW